MSDFFGVIKKEDVVDAKTFAGYVQQRVGTPYPNIKGMVILRKQIKDLFGLYPDADYQTLVRIVEWALSKKKKYAHCHSLVSAYRYAWRDGYLPELDPNPTKAIDSLIEKVLETEPDQDWCRRLSMSSGVEAKTEIYEAYTAWKRKELVDA